MQPDPLSPTNPNPSSRYWSSTGHSAELHKQRLFGGFRIIIKLTFFLCPCSTFVLPVKRNHSSSISPTATASIQAVAAGAQCLWQPFPFTRPCWSIICHPHHTERRAKPRLHLCPETGTGTGSACRTARRRAMVERGARANWCSSQTEGGGERLRGEETCWGERNNRINWGVVSEWGEKDVVIFVP